MQEKNVSVCTDMTTITMWYIQLIANYSVIEREKGLIYVTTWMNPVGNPPGIRSLIPVSDVVPKE